MQSTAIRIGTRGSPLALAQAEETRRTLAAALGLPAEAIAIVPIRTTGDRITDRPIAEAGGKGLFTKEIDEALIDGRIDIGVHSAKDMATKLPDGVSIAACLKRGDVRDAFISPAATRLADLPVGAVVGTSSLRRKALVLRNRPDLAIVDLRGNVDTRLRRIAEGRADATLLAAAGLARLGRIDRVASFLDADAWVPAPGQGAIAIAARADDRTMRERLAMIDDRATSIALAAERAFLAVLDGSCRTPIGGLARLDGDRLAFHGMIVKPDGSMAHEVTRSGQADDGERIGADAARDLAGRGGPNFFAGD
ncbi:MAG: hydroxymethylbilane synthase [Bauldia sp.]|nr:hydroxymethylbilane synthase [Bauldia sp.]